MLIVSFQEGRILSAEEPLPVVVNEVVGIVTATGQEVTRFRPNDRVICLHPIRLSGSCVVPELACEKLNLEEDAQKLVVLPLPFATAIHALSMADISDGKVSSLRAPVDLATD